MSEPFGRPDAPLCVVSLTYVAELDRIDAAMRDHVAWLAHGYAGGWLLASGRKQPRTGGILIVRGDAETIRAWVATDPFVRDGLAEAEVVPFTASMAARPLAELLA